MEEFKSEEYLVPVIPDDPLLQIDWEEEEEERMKNGEIQILKKGIRYMYCIQQGILERVNFCKFQIFGFDEFCFGEFVVMCH